MAKVCRMPEICTITGCMKSGKTTELYTRLGNELDAGCSTILILPGHAFGEDYTPKPSRARATYEGPYLCVTVGLLFPLVETCTKYDVVAVDEFQFFSDVTDVEQFLMAMRDARKTVIVSGLNMTFERKCWPSMGVALCLATEVVTLRAVCDICKSSAAIFSDYISSEPIVGSVKIDDGKNYRAVCSCVYKRDS